jgi:hypothetical protein
MKWPMGLYFHKRKYRIRVFKINPFLKIREETLAIIFELYFEHTFVMWCLPCMIVLTMLSLVMLLLILQRHSFCSYFYHARKRLGTQLECNIGGAYCPWRSLVGDHLAACWRWWRTNKRVLFYFSSVYFSFLFRKQLSELLSLFYFYIFVFLVSQVIGRSAATIKPKGCAPM